MDGYDVVDLGLVPDTRLDDIPWPHIVSIASADHDARGRPGIDEVAWQRRHKWLME